MTTEPQGLFGSRITMALLGALGGLLLGVLGTVSTGYVSAVNSDVTSLNDDIRKFQTASTELLQTLQVYAHRARNGSSLDEAQQAKLRQEITNLYGQAEAISSRDMTVAAAFNAYASALIRLRRTSEAMTGPIDAKPFVESVAAYSVASQDFVSAAVQAAKFTRRVI